MFAVDASRLPRLDNQLVVRPRRRRVQLKGRFRPPAAPRGHSGARQGDNVADDGHELLVVLGTSLSEPVLPGLLMKLEPLGCKRGVVGLVLPPAARIA
jgi:hypothetical protein